MTKSFFELIIRKGRESLLPEIGEMFNSQYRDFKSISTVTLRTAISLEEDAIEAIRKKLKSSTETKENIELNVVVDPTLIGGFAIEFQDKQYNSSIAYKLGQMRKQFSSN
jgi:F-type H+-transporting ATPase subunit delta